MKRARHLGMLICAILLMIGCDDNTGTLGMDMLPGSDALVTKTKIYEVTTRSVAVDSVYARTSTGYVGKFTDPAFGYYEASFLTELNCTQNFSFPELYKYDEATKTGSGTMAGDSIVSTALVIYYSTWFGDSLNACRMSAYELNKKLDKNRYTNINPEEYYDKYDEDALIGRKAYSAFDTSVPDSIRYATDGYGQNTYYPNVTFIMDKEFGNEILRLNREHPEYFKDSETFVDNVFKGVYIKSDLGDGTILYIDRVDLRMMICQHYTDSLGVKYTQVDGKDSLAYNYFTVFSSTKEVIQANQFLNSDVIAERVAEDEHTYIKSPAGIFTEATMPYDQIFSELEGDTLNAVKMTFTSYSQSSDYKFSMNAPTDVLLIRKSELKEFFENNELPDNITTYTATHNAIGTNQYTFSNISRLVTTCINEKLAAKEKAGSSWNEAAWEAENPDWDKVLLIPVVQIYEYTSSYNQALTGIQNDLKPGYAKLKGGPRGGALDIEVTYTIFADNEVKDYSNYKESIPAHIRERMNLK